MPRQKKKPSIEQQLRTLIATATEEREYQLAQALVEILRKRDDDRKPGKMPEPGGEV